MTKTRWITMMAVGLMVSVSQAASDTQVPGAGAIPGGGADELLLAARERAITVLIEASRGDDPYLRANVIEAMQSIPDRALPLAELGTRDKHPAVRFAALVTMGTLEMRSQAGVAERMIGDEHPSVRAAAYFAAHQCGSSINISPLGSLLMSEDPDVRANAVMLIGLIGDASAIPMLVEASRRKLPRVPLIKQSLVRIQIAEARVRLGDDAAIDALRAGVYSQFSEVRLLSVGILGRLGDTANLEDALLAILRDRREVLELRLTIVEALMSHGRMVLVREVLNSLPVVLEAARYAEPTFRAQAAFTLGAVEKARSRVRPQLIKTDPPAIRKQFMDTGPTLVLIGLLDDDSPRVRVAAAAAVIRAVSP